MRYISNRVSVSETKEVVSIVITPDYDPFKQKLLTAWIILWTAGGLIVVSQLFGEYSPEEKLFFGVWTCFWLYFEYITVHAWLWKKYGFEKLVLKGNNLHYIRSIRGSGKKMIYDKGIIKNLRLAEAPEKSILTSLNNSYWTVGGETITFEYNTKEVRIGIKLDKKEAPEIIRIIQRSL